MPEAWDPSIHVYQAPFTTYTYGTAAPTHSGRGGRRPGSGICARGMRFGQGTSGLSHRAPHFGTLAAKCVSPWSPRPSCGSPTLPLRLWLLPYHAPPS